MKEGIPAKLLEIEARARGVLAGVLRDIPFLQFNIREKADSISGNFDTGWDVLAELHAPLGTITLGVEVKGSGEPGSVRLAAQQIQARLGNRNTLPWTYGVFAAPFISARGAALCRDLGIGYFDFAGNCLLSFGQVYIRRDNWPNPAKETGPVSLWAPKAQRLLRVLLENPGVAWKTYSLTTEAAVSMGLVSEVRQQLEDRDWLGINPSGFMLSEPRALLEEWATHYRFRRRKVHLFYGLDNLAEIEVRLAQWCRQHGRQFALTEYSGAARVAAYTRYTQASAYIAGGVTEAAEAVGLRAVESGANLRLIDSYDDGVFYHISTHKDVPTVCPTQLYLDLRAFGGRGEDAAEFLFDSVLKPRWQFTNESTDGKRGLG